MSSACSPSKMGRVVPALAAKNHFEELFIEESSHLLFGGRLFFAGRPRFETLGESLDLGGAATFGGLRSQESREIAGLPSGSSRGPSILGPEGKMLFSERLQGVRKNFECRHFFLHRGGIAPLECAIYF